MIPKMIPMLSAGLTTRFGEYIKQHDFFDKKGERNTMNKIKNTKGFTLMEMLIVVAIIAVLVAIAIPTFTTSLNKARVAADAANIRSGYASVMAEILTNHLEAGTTTGKVVYDLKKDGTVVAGTENTFNGDFTTQGNATTDQDIAGQTKTWGKNKKVQYVYTPSADDGTTKAAAVQIVIAQ